MLTRHYVGGFNEVGQVCRQWNSHFINTHMKEHLVVALAYLCCAKLSLKPETSRAEPKRFSETESFKAEPTTDVFINVN